MRDAVRYRLGWWASEPFWLVYQFGLRAERVHARVLWWGERAKKGSQGDLCIVEGCPNVLPDDADTFACDMHRKGSQP